MNSSKVLLAAALASLVAGVPAAETTTPPQFPPELRKFLGTKWYGLYLLDQKIGWAESEIMQAFHRGKPAVTVSLTLSARVKMLGVAQDMTIVEKRIYLLGAGLASFFTVTTAGGREMSIRGEVGDGILHVTSVVGGKERASTTAAPEERFEDYLAEGRLVREGAKEGDEISFTQYQPTMGKSVTAISRIKEIQDRLMQGVPTRRYIVETTVKEMGVTTTSVLKEDGEVLESQIGGGFTMRLEDEATAKNVDYRSDVLLATVIRPEKPIRNPAAVREMRVRLGGVRDRELLVSSERQTYSIQANGEALLVVRVEDLAAVRPPALPLPKEAFPLELSPTLFVQSDSAELAAKAREILSGERDALKASDKIVRWVHGTLKKRFSASFSNALDVLASGGGDCTEHSVLYVALARASGLPAREVSGIVYCGEDDAFYYHQWAEAFVGKWIAVDPTFGQTQADATHIMFASGDLFSQARLLNLIGSLKIEVIGYRYDAN